MNAIEQIIPSPRGADGTDRRRPTTATIDLDEPRVGFTIDHDVGVRTTVRLSGVLCTATVRSLRADVLCLASTATTDVAVDMSAVSFIDGRALTMLLDVRRSLEERHLRCQVTERSPVVHRLLEITGLDVVFGNDG